MLCKTLLELYGMTSKDHSVTGLVVVNTDDPKSGVLKQMFVRGQHIKVHQGAFHFSVRQCLADLLVSLVAMLFEIIKNRFTNLELSSLPWSIMRGWFPQHQNTKFGFISWTRIDNSSTLPSFHLNSSTSYTTIKSKCFSMLLLPPSRWNTQSPCFYHCY